MEIKKKSQIAYEYDEDCNTPYKDTQENKMYVAVDDVIAKLNHDVDFMWALEQIEKALSKHHKPSENIMNLISHVQNRIGEMEKTLSNSRPSGADNSDFKAHKSSPKDCSNCKHDGGCSYDMHKEYEKGGCPNYDKV